jgi:hypothetical protein
MAKKGTYVNSLKTRYKSKVVKLIECYDEWRSGFPSLFNLEKSPVQFMEKGCQVVRKLKKFGNHYRTGYGVSHSAWVVWYMTPCRLCGSMYSFKTTQHQITEDVNYVLVVFVCATSN